MHAGIGCIPPDKMAEPAVGKLTAALKSAGAEHIFTPACKEVLDLTLKVESQSEIFEKNMQRVISRAAAPITHRKSSVTASVSAAAAVRTGSATRKTAETEITASVSLDGTGVHTIKTG